jgi:hypothetical protein
VADKPSEQGACLYGSNIWEISNYKYIWQGPFAMLWTNAIAMDRRAAICKISPSCTAGKELF